MYSIELNIGSLSSPVLNGGWVEVDPDFEKGSIEDSLEDNQIFSRVKIQGNLQFSYGDFEALDTLRATTAKVPIRVKHTLKDGTGTEVIYEGQLDLFGEYRENTCVLKVVVDDFYTEILDNKSEKVNILNTVNAVKCDVRTQSSRLVFYDTLVAQSSQFYTWLWGGSPPPDYVYAREEITYPDYIADQLAGSNGWAIISDNGDGTKTLGRTWSDGGFDTAVAGDFYDVPQDFSSYEVNDSYQYLGQECTIVSIRTNTRGLLLRNATYYTSETDITFSRFRKLTKVIQTIIGEFDTTIQFDTSSFSYLESYAALSHLLIINVSDLIPTGDPPVERTDGSEFAELTFDNLMTILRQKLKIYWKLEDVSGVPYFRLVHRSEINYLTGTVDLTGFHSVDWTRDNWKYNNTKLFNRLTRTTTWDNYDFRGTDILAPSLDNIAQKQEVGDDKWHFDIWDILARGADFYPADSKNEFAMLSAEPYPTDGVEQLSTMNNNGYETFSYLAGEINAINTTGAALTYSNTITPVDGYTYRIVFTYIHTSGQRPQIATVGGDLALVEVVDGENEYYATETGLGSFQLIFNNSLACNWTIEGLSIERYVYRGRTAVGFLSGVPLMNAELSVANLDETHARYELPDSTCTINHIVSEITGNRLLKNKEQTIKAPIHNPTYLDEELLVTTNKGDLEFDSLKIPMNGAMPEFTGRFI